MDKVATWIIDPKRLFREGLKNVLAEAEFEVTGECDAPEQVTAPQAADLVLFDIPIPDDDEGVAEFVTNVTSRFRGARFVVLTNQKSPDIAGNAVDAGAHGYILKDVSPDILFEALNLVLEGVVVLPTPADLGIPVPDVMKEAAPAYEDLEPELRLAIDRTDPAKDNRDIALNMCRDMGHHDAVRLCKRNRWYDLLAAIQANRQDALALPAG